MNKGLCWKSIVKGLYLIVNILNINKNMATQITFKRASKESFCLKIVDKYKIYWR